MAEGQTKIRNKKKFIQIKPWKSVADGNGWGINLAPFKTIVKKDNYGVNVGGGVGVVEEDNYGVNVGGGVGVVEEDNYGVNVGGVVGVVEEDNYGVNVGVFVGSVVGGVVGVGDNYGVNVGGVVGVVEKSSNHTTLGKQLPRLTKRLPQAIKDIGLPSFNLGTIVTYTKNPESTGIFGLVNIINNENGKADYISSGALNIEYGDGIRITPVFGGRLKLGGIFRHKSDLEKSVEATE